jgi:hypothetical protein
MVTKVQEQTALQNKENEENFLRFMSSEAANQREVGGVEEFGFRAGQGLVKKVFEKYLPTEEQQLAKKYDEAAKEIIEKYDDPSDPDLYKELGALELSLGNTTEAARYAGLYSQFQKAKEDRMASTVPEYADSKTLKSVKTFLNTDEVREKYGLVFDENDTDTDAFQLEVANRLQNIRKQVEKTGTKYAGDEETIDGILKELETEGKLKKGDVGDVWNTDAVYNPIGTNPQPEPSIITPDITTDNRFKQPAYNFNNQGLFKRSQ